METDIRLYARRDLVTIISNSDKGEKWMRSNLWTNVHTIQRDVLEDFINNIKEADLTYEEV